MVRTWIETPNNAGTGPSEQWYADDTNSYNWRTIDVHRDDHRQTTGWDVNFDDGSSEKVLVDNNNKETWSWLDVHFNSDGKRTESTIMNDDGTFEKAFHDPNNQNTWDYQRQQFNAAGQMEDLFIVNDDHSTEHTQYNNSNPAADWTAIWTREDSAGHKTEDTMFLRDGSQIHTQYDYDNTHGWQEQVATYDSNGKLDHWVDVYADGHQYYHHAQYGMDLGQPINGF